MRLTYPRMGTDRKDAEAGIPLDGFRDGDEKRKLMARIRATRWTRPSRRRRGLSEMHRVRLTAHEGPAW